MKSQAVKHKVAERIVMIEDHNEAYLAWRQAGERNKILVHIDAHIDFAWIQDRNPLNILEAEGLDEVETMLKDRLFWNLSKKEPDELVDIGNYIYPAMRDGIVKEFYWVVPDPIWKNLKERRLIKRNLKRMLKLDPMKQRKISETEDGLITAKIYNGKITVCNLSHLPEFQENILLDIDVDFLVTESTAHLYHNIGHAKVWLWPLELINRLKEKKIKTDFVTIAYSVEGGFTSLKYKYLGDELKEILNSSDLDKVFEKQMFHKKEGLTHAWSGRINEAIEEFQKALRIRPEDTASHYNLALLLYEKKLYNQASCAYQKAVALDSTYKTEYNNYGPLYERRKLRNEAEEEYEKALRLEPNNANAYRGLGNIYSMKKRWKHAVLNYKKSIELKDDDYRAHRNLGFVYIKMSRFDEALAELKKALQMNPDEGRIYQRLGFVYLKIGRINEAISAYKKSFRLGQRSAIICFRLFYLYLYQRKIYKAMQEVKLGIRLFFRRFFIYVKIK